MIKKIMKYKKWFVLGFVFLCCLNWKYFSLSKVKWEGLNPIVSYTVNPEIIGMKSVKNEEFFLSQILEASGIWFAKTNSRLTFKYSGMSRSKPASIDDLTCDINTRLDIQQGDVLFYPEKEDEDCDSTSCVYVWSCNNAIIHADVAINNSKYTWSESNSDGDVVNFKTEILKDFGFIAGLGNCPSYESIAECNLRGGTEPTTNSVMYKFPQVGKINIISEDEIIGIETIYGTRFLPFPKEGKYSLNYKELTQIQEHNQNMVVAGLFTESGRRNTGLYFNSLLAYHKRKSKKELKEEYDLFFEQAKALTNELSKNEVEAQIMFLNLGIVSGVNMKEEVDFGYFQMDKSFIDYAIQKHLELRKISKDVLETK